MIQATCRSERVRLDSRGPGFLKKVARLQRRRALPAFSLLEVIIATGILATSTVLLLGSFWTAERHGERAEERVFAQMLCQSELDQVLATPSRFRAIDREQIEGFPGWTRSVEIRSLSVDSLVCVRVTVQRDGGSRLTGRADLTAQTALETVNARPAFELVRWSVRPSEPPAELQESIRQMTDNDIQFSEEDAL